MSKKNKAKRRHTQKPVAKVVAPLAAVKATNGRGRPAAAVAAVRQSAAPAPIAPAQPVARADDRAVLPFWARMPFAVMDFWMSRSAGRSSKS